jgi:hypothetical protein
VIFLSFSRLIFTIYQTYSITLKADIMITKGCHRRMARGGHGLSKVSLGPVVPYPFTPYGQATLRAVLALPTRKVGGLRPASTPLDAPRHTPIERITPSSTGHFSNFHSAKKLLQHRFSIKNEVLLICQKWTRC